MTVLRIFHTLYILLLQLFFRDCQEGITEEHEEVRWFIRVHWLTSWKTGYEEDFGSFLFSLVCVHGCSILCYMFRYTWRPFMLLTPPWLQLTTTVRDLTMLFAWCDIKSCQEDVMIKIRFQSFSWPNVSNIQISGFLLSFCFLLAY